MTVVPKLEFDSERLSYRPLSEEDVDLAIELWTDPEVTKYVGGPYPEESLINEQSIYTRRCCNGCIGIWVLTNKRSGERIGTAILLPMPVEIDDTDWDLVVGDDIPEGEIEVGYIFKKSAWGKGYATEACKRLIQFAFEDSPLTEIVASTDHDNLASQNVLLKSGMRSVGLIYSYAEMCPGFRITKEQWLENKSAE